MQVEKHFRRCRTEDVRSQMQIGAILRPLRLTESGEERPRLADPRRAQAPAIVDLIGVAAGNIGLDTADGIPVCRIVDVRLPVELRSGRIIEDGVRQRLDFPIKAKPG